MDGWKGEGKVQIEGRNDCEQYRKRRRHGDTNEWVKEGNGKRKEGREEK